MGRFGGGGWLGNDSVGGEDRHQILWLYATEAEKFVLMGVMTVGKKFDLIIHRVAIAALSDSVLYKNHVAAGYKVHPRQHL